MKIGRRALYQLRPNEASVSRSDKWCSLEDSTVQGVIRIVSGEVVFTTPGEELGVGEVKRNVGIRILDFGFRVYDGRPPDFESAKP